jgi:hypothetical protein
MRTVVESQVSGGLSRVAFATFDTDPPEHHELCLQHGLRNLPFLEFYRDGSLVRTNTGMLTVETLTQYLNELVDASTPS